MKIHNPNPVAILMAAYNGEKFIREQIDSIRAQTYKDWTLYIQDDGSCDSTLAVIKEYQEQHERISYMETVGKRIVLQISALPDKIFFNTEI